MTGRIQLRQLCATALAFVISLSAGTASADPSPGQNIPSPRANSEFSSDSAPAGPGSELPLPYEPWQGTHFQGPGAPREPDLPPPLARARQWARRPFELSAGLGSFLPSCGSGSMDDRGCQTVSPGSGLDLALLYRVSPFFAVGGEGVVSAFSARDHGLLSSAGGMARFIGAAGRLYFADAGTWDPYLALTLGVGSLDLRGQGGSDESVSTSGLGGRIAGGVDYVFGTHLRVGPSASFARWVAWQERECSADICRAQPAVYGKLLGFATLGLRITASFGDVL